MPNPPHRPASPEPHSPSHPAPAAAGTRLPSLLVLGNDAVLAARPATAVQLAQAGLRAGFDAVLPASWGDELVADACVQQVAANPGTPAVFCACPHVAHRLLAAGEELAPFLVSIVPPPVAVARYLRAVYRPSEVRLTYVGRCPGAQSDVYDARVTPEELLRLLAERGIVPEALPDAFESVVPPDRRRFHSLPGGVPAVSALRNAGVPHLVAELSHEDFVGELAQHLLSGQPTLVDGGPRLGCACAGATPVNGRTTSGAGGRVQLVEIEPPRSTTAVVSAALTEALDLSLPLPAAARHQTDLVAALARRALDQAAHHSPATPPAPVAGANGDRHGERTDSTAEPAAPQRRRSPANGVAVVRPPAGGAPIARGTDGRLLPRAYVARRRGGPRNAMGDPPPDAERN